MRKEMFCLGNVLGTAIYLQWSFFDISF